MATEIAGLLVTGEWQGQDLEKGLDRAGLKYDQLVERVRDGQGRFVSFGDATRRTTAELKKHEAAVKDLRSQLQGGAQDIQRIGAVLTASITLPLAAAGAAIVAIGVKTSTSLNTLQAVTRATDQEMKQARETARALGADLSLPGTSAGDTAEAMTELSKGGLSLKQSLDAARGTIQLARAATIGEAQAATIAADALNTFSLAGDQADRVADLLAGAANASSGEITDMAQALAQAGAVAKGAGLSIEDTATAISLLAKNGIKGSDAGTSLKTFLLSLQSPISNDAEKMMKGLGLSVYDLQGRMKAFPALIGEFKARLDQLNPQAQAKALREIFGADAIRAARILFGEGVVGFEAMNKAITRQGSAAEIAGAKAKGLGGAWEGLKSTLETFAGDVFTDLEEPLTKIVKSLSDGVQFLADAWNALGPSTKAAVGALLGLAAAAGPVLVVIGSVAGAVLGAAGAVGSLVTAIGAVGGMAALSEILIPIGVAIAGITVIITEWVAIAVAAAVAISKAWSTNFLGIRDLTLRAWNAIKSFLVDTWHELQAAYQLIMPQLETLTRTVLGAIQAFWTAHGEKIVAVVRFAWDVVTTVVKTAIKVISSAIAGVLAVINGDWQTAWDMAVRIVDGFQSAFAHILIKSQQAMNALVAFIAAKAIEFAKAGVEWGIRLVGGFVDEIRNGMPRIAAAVLGVAVMLSSPAMLAAYAAVGVAQARARNQAFEDEIRGNAQVAASNANPQRWDDGGEYVSGAPGYTDQREKPTTSSAPGSALPPGIGGRKSGENAAVRKFKLEVEIAEVAVQAVERLNQKMLADQEYFYGQGITQLGEYVAHKLAAADALFEAENKRNDQEAKALAASGLRGRQRDLAEKQLAEKIQDTQQKHSVAIAETERFAKEQSLTVQRSTFDAAIALAQESASGMESVWRRLADNGVMTFAQAQRKIAQAQLGIMETQERALVTELSQAGDPRSAKFQEVEARLQQHRQRMANLYSQMNGDTDDALQRDEDRIVQHKSRLDSIYNAIADSEAESARDRLRVLEHMGLRKETVWKKQAELELSIEDMTSQRRIQEYQRQLAYVEKFEKNEERRAEIIAAIDSQIEAEENRSAQRRANVMDEYYEKQRQKLREWAGKVSDIFMSAYDKSREASKRVSELKAERDYLQKLDAMHTEANKKYADKIFELNQQIREQGATGWKGFFKNVGDGFRDMLRQMAADLVKSRLLSLFETVFKIPQAGGSQQASLPGSTGSGGGGFDFGGIIKNLLGAFGGGGEKPVSNHASPSGSIAAAGKAMSEAIEKSGQQAATGVEKQGANVTGGLLSVGQGIISTMLQVGTMLAAANTGGSFWKGLLLAAGMGALSGLTNGLFHGGPSQGGVGSAAGGAIGKFAEGGMVSGPGTSTSDSILAWLSNNEGIINARAVAHYGGRAFIDAINEMRLPRFGSGGIVSIATPSRSFSSGYMPPRFAPALVGNGSGPVHKHYHLNVTHRGGSDPKEIKKSTAQIQRSLSQMIQRTANDLN